MSWGSLSTGHGWEGSGKPSPYDLDVNAMCAIAALAIDTGGATQTACRECDRLLAPQNGEALVGALIDEHGLRGDFDKTQAAIAKWCATPPGGVVAPMNAAIVAPLGLAGISAGLTSDLAEPPREAEGRPRSAQRLAAELVMRSFGGDPKTLPPYQGSVPVPSAQSAIYAIDFFLNEPRLKLEGPLKGRPSASATLAFLQWIGNEVNPGATTPPDHRATAEAARRGIDAAEEGLMRAAALALAHIDADLSIQTDWSACEAEPAPADLVGFVSGAILGAEQVPGIGWVIVGGLGPNSYDMSKVSAVFDVGGDDIYEWRALHQGNQGIIDLAGSDRYKGSAEQGPACGVFGLSLIDDRAGNDKYEGETFACGVGILGVGILIDRGGDDQYSARSWSMGVGAFGAGFLFDEAGSDSYTCGPYSQGLGGPLGVGALVDSTGNDLYRADGVAPSCYGIPATSYSMAQGVGFGARGLCGGGVGLLIDRFGRDRYEAGEFSQGGGYYLGFGLLLDVEGSDLYMADRYSQGWSAHQASGTLIDLAGDDSYWGNIAANQGAAWDTTVALLLDASGDDTYRGAIGSQGSAAHQAIAALCDLDGSDHYAASGPNVQGESGDNGYHFAASGARSFSVFVDAGGGVDFFSSGRRVPGVTVLGKPGDLNAPASANLFGLMIDIAPLPADGAK